MTSTILSGKTFPKLYKWALRRNRPIMIVFAVLMALGIVIDLYVMSQFSDYSYYTNNEAARYSQFAEIGFYSIIMAQIGAIVLSMISALLTFSFLHDKRSTDMFGALPTTRGTMYLSHLCGGLTAVCVPFLAGLLIVVGMTCRTADGLLYDSAAIVCGLLGILASYTFTALIAYCCGTILDTVIVSIGVNGIYAGGIGLFWIMAGEMIPGVDLDNIFENILMTPFLTLFAPYAQCFFADFFFDENLTSFIFMIVWIALFSAAMIACGLYAAKKRKAETAQSDFNVKWLPTAVKAGVSAVAGGLIGCIAAIESGERFASMLIFTFWYIVIGFAAFFILHIIFQRGHIKSRFIPSLIAYVCTSAAVLAITFGMSTGLGMDKYVPDASNVRSVEFGYSEKFEDPENIKTITEIHKVITEGVREAYDYPYYPGNGSSYQYIYDYDYTTAPATYDEAAGGYSASDSKAVSHDLRDIMLKKCPLVVYTNFRFEYTKNIGFTTIRSYSINYTNGGAYDLQKLEQLLEKLYNSEEYKKKNCNVIWNKELRRRYALLDAPTIQYMTYTGSISTPSSDDYYYNNDPNYTTSDTVTLPSTYAFLDGLCDALAKDILADEKYYAKWASNYYSNYQSDFFGDSYLALNVSYDRNRLYKDPIVGGYDPDSYVDDLFAIITSDYTNTLAYLEKNGIPTTFDPYSVPPTYDYPTDLIESSDAARDYYFSYGMNGDVNDIEGLANEISSTLQIAGCYRAGVEDLMDWEAKHGAEFRRILSEEAVKLHKEYITKEENLSYEYTNSFLEREGMTNTGKYYKTADMIVAQLDSDCESIIRDLSKTSV